MKVLLVLPTLEAGGAESFIANLAVALKSQNVSTSIYLLAGVRGERGRFLLNKLGSADVTVYGKDNYTPKSFLHVIKLTRLVIKEQPDIVLANLYSSEIICSLVRMMTFKSKTQFVRRLASSNYKSYRNSWLVYATDRLFKKTIACSAAVENAYKKYYKRWKTELVTIQNGTVVRANPVSKIEKAHAKEKLGISSKSCAITHIGQFRDYGGLKKLATGEKGQDVVIKAFAGAFKGDSTKILLMVGQGGLRSEAEALVIKLGIVEQVKFLDSVVEPWDAMDASDVFIFPSRCEGMPNVLPEAASCGLPILASNIVEISNLNYDDAWSLVDVDNVEAFIRELKLITENLEHYRKLALENREYFINEFSMKRCAEKYIEFFN